MGVFVSTVFLFITIIHINVDIMTIFCFLFLLFRLRLRLLRLLLHPFLLFLLLFLLLRYGALANGGVIDGQQILDSQVLSEIRAKMSKSNAVRTVGIGRDRPAYLGVGYSPWIDTRLAYGTCSASGVSEDDPDPCVLGHGGVGGSCAYADLNSGLAVCVLKSCHSPITLHGPGTSQTVVEIARCIRGFRL